MLDVIYEASRRFEERHGIVDYIEVGTDTYRNLVTDYDYLEHAERKTLFGILLVVSDDYGYGFRIV